MTQQPPGPILRRAPLIGRDDALQTLTTTLAAHQVALVAGEAGVGKSRLVEAAVQAANAGTVLVATCQPFREPQTLGAVVDALRDRVAEVGTLQLSPVCAALRPLLPEWTDWLPAADGPADNSLAQHQILRAIDEVLAALGIELLVVEDVHWAEAATFDLLLFLAARRRSFALVLTYRADELATRPALRECVRNLARLPQTTDVPLLPLGRTDTGLLVSHLLGGAGVSDAFADFLHERTDGIPLVIEESLRLLVTRGDVAWVGDGWARRPLRELTVPSSVREAVLAGLDDLDEPTRAVADAAAVLGEFESVDVVSTVAGASADAASVLLVERGLFGEDPQRRVGFRHTLAAQAARDEVRGARRVAMHRRAADVLRARALPPVTRLARHCREAGLTAEAARYSDAAASIALAAGDVSTSTAVLRDAVLTPGLAAADALPLVERIPLWGLTDRDDVEAVALRLREWLAGADDRVQRAQLRFHLSRMLLAVARHTEAFAELAAAVDDLAPLPQLQARSLAILACARDASQPAANARAWGERALVLLPALSDEDRLDVEVDVLCAAMAGVDVAAGERARAMPTVAPTRALATSVARCNLNIGDMAMHWGSMSEAHARLDGARTLAGELELTRLHYLAIATEARCSWFEGRWDMVREQLEHARSHPGAAPEPVRETELVEVLLAAVEDPEPMLGKLRALAHTALDELGYGEAGEAAGAYARYVLAGVPDPTGDHVLALTSACLAPVQRGETWIYAVNLVPAHVDALLAAGEHAQAHELSTVLDDLLQSGSPPTLVAVACWMRAALAEADRPADAVEGFDTARDAYERAGRRHLALLAAQRRSRALHAAGEESAAISAHRALAAEFADLGARWDAAQVARELAAWGAVPHAPWRGGRRGYGAKLSPREVEVVELLATGRTNREIAARLSRSPKTVSSQLQSAMRKLDVSTRTAAAMRAIELGLIPAPDAVPS